MKAYATRVWHFVSAFVLRVRSDEPLRNRLRPIITIASGALVANGVVSQRIADYIVAAVLFVLGFAAIEWSRKLVTPTSKLGPMLDQSAHQGYVDGVKDAAEAVVEDLSEKGEAALAALSPEIQRVLDQARDAASYFNNRGEHRKAD